MGGGEAALLVGDFGGFRRCLPEAPAGGGVALADFGTFADCAVHGLFPAFLIRGGTSRVWLKPVGGDALTAGKIAGFSIAKKPGFPHQKG